MICAFRLFIFVVRAKNNRSTDPEPTSPVNGLTPWSCSSYCFCFCCSISSSWTYCNVYSKHALAKQQGKRPYITTINFFFPFYSESSSFFIIIFLYFLWNIFALVCIFAQLKKFSFSYSQFPNSFRFCSDCVIFAFFFPRSTPLWLLGYLFFFQGFAARMCPHAVRLYLLGSVHDIVNNLIFSFFLCSIDRFLGHSECIFHGNYVWHLTDIN